MMPRAGPRLMIAVAYLAASSPYSSSVNSSWHSSIATTIGCRPRSRRAASSGVTLNSGAWWRGRPSMTSARRSSSAYTSASEATQAALAESVAPLA